MKTYTTLRGRVTTKIPYGQLNREQRLQVMISFVEGGRKSAMKKHNIEYHTIHHIKFHNPDLLREAYKIVAAPIAKYKANGLNSRDVSKALNIPIEKVNELWEHAE